MAWPVLVAGESGGWGRGKSCAECGIRSHGVGGRGARVAVVLVVAGGVGKGAAVVVDVAVDARLDVCSSLNACRNGCHLRLILIFLLALSAPCEVHAATLAGTRIYSIHCRSAASEWDQQHANKRAGPAAQVRSQNVVSLGWAGWLRPNGPNADQTPSVSNCCLMKNPSP